MATIDEPMDDGPVTPAGKPSRLNVAKDWVSLLQGVATILGLVAAAWWFIFQELSAARINLEISAKEVRLDNERTLVHVSMKIVNAGYRPVEISKGELQIRQVLPAEKELRVQLDSKGRSLGVFDWKRLSQMPVPYSMPLGPGESDFYYFESIIPPTSRVVRIYGEAKSPSLNGASWSAVTFLDVNQDKPTK